MNRGIGANSLFNEPSQFARVLGILYYAYLKCNEYSLGKKITIAQVFNTTNRWVTVAFLWGMLTMGSGTAFVCLAVLSIYFMKGKYFFLTIPIFVGAFYILEKAENNSFNRAHQVAVATLTGEKEEVMEADGSAATRIAPLLNTLNMDFSDYNNWIGHGCDSTSASDWAQGKVHAGHIDDYGLISYVLEMIFIFSCCIRFRSLGTVFLFLGIGGGMGNISYGWGLLMIFSCIRYYSYNNSFLLPDSFNE